MAFTELDKNFALLLINFQKGLIADIPEADALETITNASLLVKACLETNHPIITVTSNPFLGTLVTARCDDPMFPVGTNLPAKEAQMRLQGWFDLLPEFAAISGAIPIVKSGWDAFFQTSLQQQLNDLNITQLLICGITTSLDIEATAISALERGYHLCFPTDAIADSDPIGSANVKAKKLPKSGQTGSASSLIGLIR